MRGIRNTGADDVPDAVWARKTKSQIPVNEGC